MNVTQFATGLSRFVLVEGARIHYQEYNPDDVEKPGLLFIHGMWAHLHWWDHIVPFFVDRFRVVAMDLGGMGDSESRSRYTARGFGEEVLAVIEDAAIAPATVVAHSLGGTPAAFACHTRPDQISRAVFIDSRLYLQTMPGLRPHEITQMKVARKRYARAEDAIDRYRLIPPGGAVAPEILKHVATQGLRNEAEGWAWKFDPALNPQLDDDPDRVIPAGIATPVDYIFGDHSDVVSPTMAGLIQAHFPNCGVPVAIPGGNHHLLLEQPELLVAALRSLFSRSPNHDPA